MRLLASTVRLLLALALPASAASAQYALPKDGNYTIGKVDSIYSATLKEQRKIIVYTPPSYNDSTYTPQRYPVVYILDGEGHFHSFTGILQALGTGVNGTYVVPEMIVVAITNTDRMRDMSPTHVETGLDGKPAPAMKTTGGMGNFLSFIKSELIPKIDGQYRTAPYRVFVGHSLGGITAIQALYTIPETFNAYVAIDPSLWWDNTLLLKQARAKVSAPGAFAGKSLFVAQANTINPADTTLNVHYNAIAQFNGVVNAFNKSGLRFGFRAYPDDSHGSVPLIAEYDALRFIFAGYSGDLLAALDRPAYVTEHFAEVSQKLGYTVKPSEQMLDMMGMIAMSQESWRPKALELLQMSVDLYPTSAHAHESLGNALAMAGDSEKATAQYQAALRIQPGRKSTEEAIKRMERMKAAKPAK